MYNKKIIVSDFLFPFIILLVTICFLRSGILFSTDIIPINDYATNDWLIVQAKSHMLWHGNGSRAGFFHPGPFFNQIMAWFEILFYDWITIFGSFMGAHFFAVAVLYSLSIAMFYFALRAYFRNQNIHGRAAFFCVLLTVAISCLIIDTREYYVGSYFFTSYWPPYLYMTASFLLLTGLIWLYSRHAWALPTIVTAFMIYIHGHASFIGLVPVMILFMGLFFILNNLIAGKTFKDIREATINYLKNNKKAVGLSFVIVGLFSFPIILNTLVNWPGEIPLYFTFTGNRTVHSVSDVSKFLVRFLDLSLIAIPCYLWIAFRSQEQKASVKIILLLLFTFIPPVLLYCFKGIDIFNYKYPLFWMGPLFAFAAALSIIEIAEKIEYKGMVYCLLFIFSLYTLHQFKAVNTEFIDAKDFKQADALFHSFASAGSTTKLEFATDDLTSYLYSVVLASLDNRSGEPSFCIPENLWSKGVYSNQYKCKDQLLSAKTIKLMSHIDDQPVLFTLNNASFAVQISP